MNLDLNKHWELWVDTYIKCYIYNLLELFYFNYITVCSAGYWGDGFINECGCGSLGTLTCDNVKGCVCNDEWTGPRCDMDVDECKDPNICNDINKVCVNTPGAYRCDCRTGFQLNSDTVQCEGTIFILCYCGFTPFQHYFSYITMTIQLFMIPW